MTTAEDLRRLKIVRRDPHQKRKFFAHDYQAWSSLTGEEVNELHLVRVNSDDHNTARFFVRLENYQDLLVRLHDAKRSNRQLTDLRRAEVGFHSKLEGSWMKRAHQAEEEVSRLRGLLEAHGLNEDGTAEEGVKKGQER